MKILKYIKIFFIFLFVSPIIVHSKLVHTDDDEISGRLIHSLEIDNEEGDVNDENPLPCSLLKKDEYVELIQNDFIETSLDSKIILNDFLMTLHLKNIPINYEVRSMLCNVDKSFLEYFCRNAILFFENLPDDENIEDVDVLKSILKTPQHYYDFAMKDASHILLFSDLGPFVSLLYKNNGFPKESPNFIMLDTDLERVFSVILSEFHSDQYDEEAIKELSCLLNFLKDDQVNLNWGFYKILKNVPVDLLENFCKNATIFFQDVFGEYQHESLIKDTMIFTNILGDKKNIENFARKNEQEILYFTHFYRVTGWSKLPYNEHLFKKQAINSIDLECFLEVLDEQGIIIERKFYDILKNLKKKSISAFLKNTEIFFQNLKVDEKQRINIQDTSILSKHLDKNKIDQFTRSSKEEVIYFANFYVLNCFSKIPYDEELFQNHVIENSDLEDFLKIIQEKCIILDKKFYHALRGLKKEELSSFFKKSMIFFKQHKCGHTTVSLIDLLGQEKKNTTDFLASS